jgi:hypothetical protein
MRRTWMKFLAAAFAAVLLFGCQATPETDVVVQEQMIDGSVIDRGSGY